MYFIFDDDIRHYLLVRNDYELYSIRYFIKNNIKSLNKEFKKYKKSINLKFCSFNELKTFCNKRSLYFDKLNELLKDYYFVSKVLYCYSSLFCSFFILYNTKKCNSYKFLPDYIIDFSKKYKSKSFLCNLFN